MNIYKKFKELIPLIVLTILSASSTVEYFYTNQMAVLEFKQILSAVLIFYCWAAFFLFNKFYRFSLIIMILLGLFGVQNPNGSNMSTTLWLGDLAFNYQPPYLLITFLTLIISAKSIYSQFLMSVSPTEEEQEKSSKRGFEENVERYKMNYKNKNTDDLLRIINDKRYTPEAHTAAKILLNELSKNKQFHE